MKTNSIILILFAIALSCGHTQAQEELPYRPFELFNNDTIRYLDYNFNLRSDQYVGKTAGELLRDLELPVIYVSDVGLESDPANKTYGFAHINLVIRVNRDKDEDWSDASKDYYIQIWFKKPTLDLSWGNETEYKYVYYWMIPESYESLKNLELSGVITNDFLFSDRRRIHETSTFQTIGKNMSEAKKAEQEKWSNQIRVERRLREDLRDPKK